MKTPRGVHVDPWFLGSPDENDVQGQAGTPVDVNNLSPDFKTDVGAAGAEPARKRLPRRRGLRPRPVQRQAPAGTYTLRSWIDDVTPPRVRLLTPRVAAGRPSVVVRITDAGAGVDPLSLTLSYAKVLVGAAEYDRETGIAVLPATEHRTRLAAGTTRARVRASDFQETKNVNTSGSSLYPNTRFENVRIRVVDGPTARGCRRRARASLSPQARRADSKRALPRRRTGSPRSLRAVVEELARQRRPHGARAGQGRGRTNGERHGPRLSLDSPP